MILKTTSGINQNNQITPRFPVVFAFCNFLIFLSFVYEHKKTPPKYDGRGVHKSTNTVTLMVFMYTPPAPRHKSGNKFFTVQKHENLNDRLRCYAPVFVGFMTTQNRNLIWFTGNFIRNTISCKVFILNVG